MTALHEHAVWSAGVTIIEKLHPHTKALQSDASSRGRRGGRRDRRRRRVTEVSVLDREMDEDDMVDGGDIYARDPDGLRRWDIPPGIEVYEINGPFFFGAAETFKDTIARVAGKPKVLIIRMRDVLSLDSTGMYALKDVVHRSRKDGTTVLLSDVHMQPLVALTGSPILDEIGKDNLFGNLGDALNRARAVLGLPPAARPEGTGATVRRESSS